MQELFDVAVIGGGVVGTAVARECVKYDLKVVLLEARGDVAEGISKANSGVIHAGFNVRTGSLKARFNLEGLAELPGLADTLEVPYRISGKLVIAQDEGERAHLEKLLAQGKANGCPGLSIVGEERIRELQPGVQGRYALHSAATGIISPYDLTIAYAENAAANGAVVLLDAEVAAVEAADQGFRLTLADGRQIRTRVAVNSAGNHSDQVADLAGPQPLRLNPCRGEYFIVDVDAAPLLDLSVYPVPPADGSGLGVHLTPTINGNILIGPSADYIDDPDDTATTAPVMAQLKSEAFQLLPALRDYPFIRAYAGIRPKLFHSGTGKTFEDFVIQEHPAAPGFINLIGIESPGLTASPALARFVVSELIGARLSLHPRKGFLAARRNPIPRTKDLGWDAWKALADQDPRFAEVVCRCERVSEAEIRRAIENPLGSRTLSAIKKRTHAMTGRCQGGYCLSKIVQLLMEDYGMKPEEIRKDGPASVYFPGGRR